MPTKEGKEMNRGKESIIYGRTEKPPVPFKERSRYLSMADPAENRSRSM